MVQLQSGKIRKAELHWYEAHGIGKKKMKIIKLFGLRLWQRKKKDDRFALCVENKDCEDLEKRKIYEIIPDKRRQKKVISE